eukprot:4990177-Ditylum_brightwellii.AAC.1
MDLNYHLEIDDSDFLIGGDISNINAGTSHDDAQKRADAHNKAAHKIEPCMAKWRRKFLTGCPNQKRK